MAKVEVDQKISFGHEVVQCKIQISNDVLGIKYIESTNANQFKGYEKINIRVRDGSVMTFSGVMMQSTYIYYETTANDFVWEKEQQIKQCMTL